MAIQSCDHGNYIVVYDTSTSQGINCPVCEIEEELESANERIEELETE